MKTAKITKRVLRVMRVAGTVLILVAFVLFLYAVINTNTLWSKTTDKGERAYKTKAWDDFSSDMAAYDVDGLFMRLDFDGRYFSALSAAARKSVALKENEGNRTAEEILNEIAEAAKPAFADYYRRANENNNKNHRAKVIEDSYAWFGNDLDAAAFAEANSNIDEILEYHEIAVAVEYLEGLYTPPPKLAGKGLKPPNRRFCASFC